MVVSFTNEEWPVPTQQGNTARKEIEARALWRRGKLEALCRPDMGGILRFQRTNLIATHNATATIATWPGHHVSWAFTRMLEALKFRDNIPSNRRRAHPPKTDKSGQ